MGKKKTNSNLGRGILKDRAKSSKGSKVSESWLHTSELNDGCDWNRINLRSVTEQNNLDDFLTTAELAGTEFTAERLNVKVIDPTQHTGLPSAEESIAIREAQEENLECLQIPRRPRWDSSTTAEQLDQRERESFVEWRRQLALLQEKEHIVLTPFERNLEFWRQLWRVIERSDVIVQIVDARNPLLFRCEDLEKYVKEVSDDKENVILISKADLLTQAQRQHWAEYFSQQGITVAFWSAVLETERLEMRDKEDAADGDDDDSDVDDDVDEEDEDEDVEEEAERSQTASGSLSTNMEGMAIGNDNQLDMETSHEEKMATEGADHEEDDAMDGATGACGGDDVIPININLTVEGIQCNPAAENSNSRTDNSLSKEDDNRTDVKDCDDDDSSCDHDVSDSISRTDNSTSHHTKGEQALQSEESSSHSLPVSNVSHLLTGEELLNFLRKIHAGRLKVNKDVTTVGMVGYPNVGKSSTINALLQEKKVPVSATPGRTKHFQTLFVEPTLCLCDCPGLVMPSFVTTKADMYLNGILSIDQMRDCIPPVSLLCQRMPRKVLELTYGINLIKPKEGEDPTRPPTAMEFLNAHAYVRGFMTQKAVPDCFRSARIVLKDYVNGKLLYRVPPPITSPEDFKSIHFPSLEVGEVKAGSRPKKSAGKPMINEGGQTVKKSADKKVDESFFAKPSAAHIKALPPRVGMVGQTPGGIPTQGAEGVFLMGKPWKKQKRGKKEKLRRVYGHLDEK